MENIVEKSEIAHFEQFHFFQQYFPKAFFFNMLKRVYNHGGQGYAFQYLHTLTAASFYRLQWIENAFQFWPAIKGITDAISAFK